MNNESTMNNRDYLYAIYGRSTFVKIKPALGIGKILFAFVDRETKASIDCYISLLDYEELLDSIKTRYFQRKIAEEKAKGEKYPKPVWESLLGGCTKNGKTIHRQFSISPGTYQYAVFTAKSGPAVVSDGKCVPVKKNEENKDEFNTIPVGVMNYEEFRKMMLESEKYLNVWYEFTQKKVLFQELQKMMQRPASNEKFVDMHQEDEEKSNGSYKEATETSTANQNSVGFTQQVALKQELFKTRSKLQEKGGKYYLRGCRKNDATPIYILFLPDYIKKCPEKWEQFKKLTQEKENVAFNISYAEKNNTIYFSSFAS